MKCPHCLDSYHPQISDHILGQDVDWLWRVHWQTCPSCKKFIIILAQCNKISHQLSESFFVYPKAFSRAPISKDVPGKYAEDFKEACLVIGDSPKASASLGRRCLQVLLREEAKVKPSNLIQEIDEVLKSQKLPLHLADSIGAVRNIGNFAAHPIKSTSTGEIVDVEPGEVEWILDVLEGLFDFYFVQPAKLKKKREALNKKFAEAGKPPMK